jgi:hypothetical protein
MGKDNNGPYIRQLAENENLYSYLQRQTLEEVHRLSERYGRISMPMIPG